MSYDKEFERYARQMIIPQWGKEVQEKLSQKKIFVAGVGGLGSPVVTYLALAGIGEIILCDRDKVEISNLNRQFLHNDITLGHKKPMSGKKMAQKLNPLVKITPLCIELTRENAFDLIRGMDLIIDCLDNGETRLILNEIAVNLSIPYVFGAVREVSGQVSILFPPETPCLACIYPEFPPKEIFPILGATAGVIGSIQAMEAIKLITGIGETLKGKLLFWDGDIMNFHIIPIQKNKKCKVCSKIC